MAGKTVTIPPDFEEAVQDFVEEQLMREPFCIIDAVEEQVAPLLEKLRVFEGKLVRYSVSQFARHAISTSLLSRVLSPVGSSNWGA